MAVAVAIEGIVICLMLILLISLLRSHGEVVAALHDLGVSLDPEGSEDRSPTSRPDRLLGAVNPAPVGGAPPRPGDEGISTHAFDVTGSTPSGGSASVAVAGVDHTTLLAFLSSGCLTCERFWATLRTGATGDLPGTATRVVAVTRGPDSESPAEVERLAGDEVPVIMSTEAWADYEVPGSPFFVLVHGPASAVVGAGTAADWDQLTGLLGRAVADGGHDLSPVVSRREAFTGRRSPRVPGA